MSDAGGAAGLGSSRNEADQDDVELAYCGVKFKTARLSNENFERLDIPSRKIGRPIEGGPNTLAVRDQPTCATRSWAFASAAVAGCAGS